MRPVYFPILAAMCCATQARAAIVPDCAGTVEIRAARVTRVEPNGVLILSDGRAVLLEGIRLPDADLHDRAIAALRGMAMAGPVTFAVTAPKQDRYGRVRAQGFAGAWLQMALLERGLARVQIAPDRNECAPDLYEAEGRARHQGIWALAAYAPQPPDAAKIGDFQLIDGRVTGVGRGEGRVFIDFGGDGRRLLAVVIQPEDRRAFRGTDFDGLIGRHIRVRGIVQDYRGRPEIALSNSAQIEVLD